MLVEACVDSVAGALAAERLGARRVELCTALAEGGTTPSVGMIAAVRARVEIPIVAMIRPRGGDFLYDEEELDVMRRDIVAAREVGADGVAVGVLRRDGSVDLDALRTLRDAAADLPVTFHRAFDMSRDLPAALEALADVGIARVLTSGAASRAVDGADTIGALVRQAAGRVEVMAGGGIRAADIPRLGRAGVREVHVGGAVMVSSTMAFRRDSIAFGRPLPSDEFTLAVGDVERWRSVIAAAGQLTNTREPT